jgi:hypothetical protein
MSTGGNSDERKVAVMLLAMQDMRVEMEGMLKALQAGVRATSAASAQVAQAGAGVVPAVTQAASYCGGGQHEARLCRGRGAGPGGA